MIAILPKLALMSVAMAMPGATLASVPATLSCTADHHLNYRADVPELFDSIPDEAEFGALIVHVNPSDGEWALEIPGSAALTNDGGRFEVIRRSSFAAYHQEWVGIDHDTMLRIWGGGNTALRFLFVSDDYAVIVGACVEPDEAFLLLQGTAAS